MAFASIGTVLTKPSVNIPNSSNDYATTKLQGQVSNTGTDPKYWMPNGINNVGLGYFRYSKIEIPPIFCNDIYGSNMRSTKEQWFYGAGVNFDATVTDLEPNTKYAYCAVVSNDGSYKPTDIRYGGVYVFTTLPCASCEQTIIHTIPAEGVTSNSAYLKGDYNSTKPTKTYFEYRKNVSGTPWVKVNNSTNGAGSSGGLNYSLSGLSQMTEYVFRAVIEEKNVCPLSFTGTYPTCTGNGSNGLSCPAGFTTSFTSNGIIQCNGTMAANSYAAPQYGADFNFLTLLPNGGSSSSSNNVTASNGLGYGNTGWTYNSSSAGGSSSSTSGGNSSSSNSGGSTSTNGTSGNGTTGGSTSGNGNGANGNPFNGSGTIGGGIFGPSIGNSGTNGGSGNGNSGNGGFGNGNNGSGNGNDGTGNGNGNDGTGLGTGPGTVLPPPKIGDKINPLSDAIVRYHEGVETVFTRQIKNYPGFAALYGYQDGQDLQSFADNLSHTFAQAFGYYAGGGREIRVSIPDIAAYEFGMKDDTLAVYEYYGGYLTGIAVVTDKLKNKYGYEYYFQKH